MISYCINSGGTLVFSWSSILWSLTIQVIQSDPKKWWLEITFTYSSTPLKIIMESKHHPIEKESHLQTSKPSLFGSMLNFAGIIIQNPRHCQERWTASQAVRHEANDVHPKPTSNSCTQIITWTTKSTWLTWKSEILVDPKLFEMFNG